MRLRTSNLIACGTALAVLAGSESFAASKSSVVDLGAATSGLYLNNTGQVASQDFFYSGGRFTSLDSGIIPVGLTDDGRIIDGRGPYTYYWGGVTHHNIIEVGRATSGNSAGILVGSGTIPYYFAEGYSPNLTAGYTYQPLSSSQEHYVNPNNLITPYAPQYGQYNGPQALGYGIMPGDPTGRGSMFNFGGGTTATAINDANQVVGSYVPPADLWMIAHPHAMLTDLTGSKIQDLGTLGGLTSAANAINDAGQVVGKADTAAGNSHAFLYTTGKMTDLGTLPGFSTSNALGLNDRGDVVGTSGGHAFEFSKGIMEDLNDRLPATLGITLDEADKINDSGQIIAYGHGADGVEHGYLLDPTATPEPSTLALLGVAGLGYGARRLRKMKK